MSYNQPGPYGGQPQTPQPGYGSPYQGPQQTPPPYGQVPQQDPYAPPTPPAWGQPPQGGRRKTGLIIGVVAVAALAVIGGGVALTTLLDESSEPGAYRLSPPSSFQGLSLTESGPRVEAIKKGQEQATMPEGATRVAVVYTDGNGTDRLVVSGGYGRFPEADPAAQIMKGFHAMGLKDADIRTEDAGKPEGGAMRCANYPIGNESLPICMWGDQSSTVSVTVPIENKPAVGLDALAEQARALRAVMEIPAS